MTMQQHIGVKVINAKPMTRQEYNDFRGWALPADENGDDAGFLVEYTDGGRGNTDLYAGYVSWSPADVFERAYRVTSGMTFGLAIEALKLGEKVSRAGWNGKGMWLYYVPENTYEAQTDAAREHFGNFVPYRAYIAMKTVDNEVVPWLASQTDMLAEDWEVVP
ncbi:Protein of unknown function DUF2829 [uncultured Caudovirales phage]|uniref:Thoeris anti-defense 2-like domain-containing protein n=1 Tax=uncultured Caudovirales phage TaxID=2100421 RepID=A0A6J5KNT7_9CAUD|nr:Protein of unknown function DUF2829 [uncultured Caudovirales phage]